jgi:hypothetical protein
LLEVISMSHTKHEPPVRFIGQMMEGALEGAAQLDHESMEEHVETMHIPPRRRDPVTAIPFANVRLDDVTVSKAIELLRTSQDPSIDTVARMLDVPVEALERALSEYKPRWRDFLFARSCW